MKLQQSEIHHTAFSQKLGTGRPAMRSEPVHFIDIIEAILTFFMVEYTRGYDFSPYTNDYQTCFKPLEWLSIPVRYFVYTY